MEKIINISKNMSNTSVIMKFTVHYRYNNYEDFI